MKLVEAYSLTGGQKIDTPEILEKFYPLPFQKYITFQPFSKDAKNYSYYYEVLVLLKPLLDAAGIQIVQIGAAGEPAFDFCFPTMGKTNINNVAYLVKHGLLHFGADSVSSHLAGFYNKPLVALYAANYTECVSPYFGNKSKHIYLEADRKGNKPSFAFNENPKTIDTIKPETVAQSVCQSLNLDFKHDFKTVLINPFYSTRTIELVPNQTVDPRQFGMDGLVVRMDVLHDENRLIQQSQIGKVAIVCNRPLPPSYIQNYTPQIKEITYEVKESFCLPFVNNIIECGIKLNLYSYLPIEKLNPIKFEFMDIGVIWHKNRISQNDYPALKDIPANQLYYKSNKLTLANNKIYQSIAGLETDQTIQTIVPEIQPIIDSETFWKEADFCYFLSK